jgi:hypothetical protein
MITTVDELNEQAEYEFDKVFDDWFNEVESYAFRSERFYEDMLINGSKSPDKIVPWLKAAFDAGKNA